MENNYCLVNSITTPDGTELRCYTKHDFKTHYDTVSNEQYMNDGLGYYMRRSMNKVPYTENSIFIDLNSITEQFDTIRSNFTWGSYGKTGKDPIKYIPLKELDTDHIYAILETQRHIFGSPTELFLKEELKYRNK